jgi:hypothetical protein
MAMEPLTVWFWLFAANMRGTRGWLACAAQLDGFFTHYLATNFLLPLNAFIIHAFYQQPLPLFRHGC